MKQTIIYQSLSRLLSDLKPMTWGERIEHIWLNYKEYILMVGLGLFIVTYLAISMFGPRKELVMGGISANVAFTEEGKNYLQAGYIDFLDGDTSTQKADLFTTGFSALTDEADFEVTYHLVTQTLSMVTNKEVDYFIMDKVALETYLSQDVFLDLREIFTEDELLQNSTSLIKFLPVDENGTPLADVAYPVAIEISETPFVRDCAKADSPVYIAFVVNAPNKENLHDFWDYLNAWQSTGG